MLQISFGLLSLMVYTVALVSCVLVFGLFCLEYFKGDCLTGKSRFTFVFFEYIAGLSAPHYYDVPLLDSKGGWRALSMINVLLWLVNTQPADRKQSRTDMTTILDFAPICSGPHFLLIIRDPC